MTSAASGVKHVTPEVRLRPLPSAEDQLPRDLHPVIRRILLSRGITGPDDLDLELAVLLEPKRLGGLAEAADLVAGAVQSGRNIMVVGDFDADGATGTALAVGVLRACGADHVDFRVPNRFEFGYGLTPQLVDTLSDHPPDLLITVDSGICCVAGVQRARAMGMQVVVTDHHLPGETLPAAHAIVNPNLPGDEFPSKALAGVGVMFYLLSGVRSALREAGWFGRRRPEPRLADWLDLVALGTVADLVSLDHNNRILVHQGLQRIRQGLCRPGLMALLKLGRRDYRHCVASDLAFAVAPRLNAAGRLEDMGVGIRCLLCEDPEEAMELATLLDSLNAERRALQQQMQTQALDQLQGLLDRLGGQRQPFSLCLFDASWHQGIVGLVASKIKEATHRPVVAFAPENDGASRLKGSARSIAGLHIRDVLAHVDAGHPGLIQSFGGHAMAAGLALERDGLEAFGQALDRSVRHFLGDEAPDAEIRTDGDLPAGDINLEFARDLEKLGPWGQKFPEPLFEGAFEVIEQRVVGGAHLKMSLRPLDGHVPVDAIAFGVLPEQLPDQRKLRLVYRLGVNRFRGHEICQIMVENILG